MSKELYRLKLKSLAYVSSVDTPAQETAIARLLKRVSATARVAKLSDELGLVFGWALTTKADGVDYFDLQGDNVTEDDLIKIAAEWMSDGGAADTMHDREQDGRAVFCMPMTTEVAKAVYGDKVGGELGTYGLLVAIKPSAEDFAKFKSGELTGFSIDGTGIREPVQARKAAPTFALGDRVEALVDHMPGMAGMVGKVTTVRAGEPPYYGVTFDDQGAMPGEHKWLTEDEIEPAADDNAKRASRESPQAKTSPNVNPVSKETTVNELDELKALKAKLEAKIAELEAANTELKATAELTDGEKAHIASLSTSEAKRFRSLEKSARLAEVAKALEADAVVVEFNGQQYRKSAGPAVIELAKAAKAQADEIAKQAAELKKARIRKAASEILKNAPGDNETHDFIVEQLENNEKAIATLKGLVAASTIGKSAPGFGGSQDEQPDGPAAELAALAKRYAEANKCDERTARLAVLKTEDGRRLYGEAEDLRKRKALGIQN